MRKSLSAFTGLLLLSIGVTAGMITSQAVERKASPVYKAVLIQTELQAHDYLQYEGKIEEAKAQIQTAYDRIQQAEALLDSDDPIVVLNAEAVIENANLQIDQISRSLSEYQLEENLDKFYRYYEGELLEKQYQILDFNQYQISCNLALQDYRERYLSASISEMEDKLSIERAKQEQGYSTGADVGTVRARLDTAYAELYDARSQKRILKKHLEIAGGDAGPQTLSVEWRELGDSYVQNFLDGSVQRKLYMARIEAYSQYENDNSINEESRKIANLQVQLEQTNLERYDSETELYVMELCETYDSLRRKAEAADERIEAQNARIEANSLLYEKGQIQKVTVKELETELSKIEYEKAEYCSRALIILYLLDYEIEGQEF